MSVDGYLPVRVRCFGVACPTSVDQSRRHAGLYRSSEQFESRRGFQEFPEKDLLPTLRLVQARPFGVAQATQILC